MAMRFTESDKWISDRWFRALQPNDKLAWLYILDRCDDCGVFELDRDMADFCIGLHNDWETFISTCGDRLLALSNGKYLIVKYVKFQQRTDELKARHGFHKSILRKFAAHGLNPLELGYKVVESESKKDKDPSNEASVEGGSGVGPGRVPGGTPKGTSNSNSNSKSNSTTASTKDRVSSAARNEGRASSPSRKKNPPPPPKPNGSPSAGGASLGGGGGDFGIVFSLLSQAGVSAIEPVVASLRERSVSSEHAVAIIEHWRTLEGVQAGALAHRLRNAVDGDAPAKGWPIKPKPKREQRKPKAANLETFRANRMRLATQTERRELANRSDAWWTSELEKSRKVVARL